MKLNLKIWKDQAEFDYYYTILVWLKNKRFRNYPIEISKDKRCSIAAIFKSWNTRFKRKTKKKTKINYKEYIISNEWKSKRKQYIKASWYICECCNLKFEDKNLCLHHHTYKRIWKEHANDLAVLCHICHEKIHFNNWVKVSLKESILRYRYEYIKKQTKL